MMTPPYTPFEDCPHDWCLGCGTCHRCERENPVVPVRPDRPSTVKGGLIRRSPVRNKACTCPWAFVDGRLAPTATTPGCPTHDRHSDAPAQVSSDA